MVANKTRQDWKRSKMDTLRSDGFEQEQGGVTEVLCCTAECTASKAQPCKSVKAARDNVQPAQLAMRHARISLCRGYTFLRPFASVLPSRMLSAVKTYLAAKPSVSSKSPLNLLALMVSCSIRGPSSDKSLTKYDIECMIA